MEKSVHTNVLIRRLARWFFNQLVILCIMTGVSFAGIIKNERVDVPISGKVTSGDGEPIPGVNVLLKGTAIGTVTDADGNYSLQVPDLTSTLIFSYIGYESVEVALDGRSTVNVTLNELIQSLDELVVVGYSTQKKADIT